MAVVVVYAVESRQIRRVIVSDVCALDRAGLSQGEAALEAPLEAFSQSDAQALKAYVASVIGEPTCDCRCVEVDKTGKVVAVYSADPTIDKPLLSPEFTLELHKTAGVGDVKVNGQFEPKEVPPPDGDRPPYMGT